MNNKECACLLSAAVAISHETVCLSGSELTIVNVTSYPWWYSTLLIVSLSSYEYHIHNFLLAYASYLHKFTLCFEYVLMLKPISNTLHTHTHTHVQHNCVFTDTVYVKVWNSYETHFYSLSLFTNMTKIKNKISQYFVKVIHQLIIEIIHQLGILLKLLLKSFTSCLRVCQALWTVAFRRISWVTVSVNSFTTLFVVCVILSFNHMTAILPIPR